MQREESAQATPQQIYTLEERARRDSTRWTLVQGILAPLQFLIFVVSLALVIRYLVSDQGYVLATWSIVGKTAVLFAIMITGSIWEKVVFGKWLFARPFFWEDVFSFVVIALHSLYLYGLFSGSMSPDQLMVVALSVYAAYLVNAGQFIRKLRLARREVAVSV